ncbi:MAG: PGF-CTERM sorting domain-containing protein [Methanosarcina sp.]|nr:PGF-CTERM sorting domain-containing protein [Methanosarcina sp.]MDD3316083.1 PGF-CTERM sorting domain-containing protein [Methanosarcina sp.]MDD4305149.1 PGF-CTERM sorting domain-containing protein [Methanosarcina sp.]MDD4620971.1 PGF-CTERM sorting domain-containing protein [Methanosarcina sp.]NLN44198.1 hypothetical protein [Methanosarcina sp.]
MKKHLPILLLSIFILGAVFSSAIAGATDNPAVNETASKILKTNKSINKAANQTVNKSANQTVNETVSLNETCPVNLTEIETGIPVAEQKFRVGPTVVLRPVNDVITKNEDGLVELYIDNPSLNDVTLNVDARISVPAGIHVYGQGFAQTGAAGTVYGIFSVPPGNARTIYIDIKGDKVGTSTIHFSGLYWPGDDKDDYNPISLSHPFVVKEASENPGEASSFDENGGVKAQGEGSFSAPGFGILIAVIGLLGVYAAKRK